MEPLELLFSFAIVTRVLYGISLGVGIVGSESHINADVLSRWLMHDGTFCLDCELHIVAISTVDNPDPLDLLCEEMRQFSPGITNQSQASNTASIGEGDMFPVRFQLPARLSCTQRSGYRVGTWESLFCPGLWLLHLS